MTCASRGVLDVTLVGLPNTLNFIWPKLAIASSAFFAAGAEHPPEAFT